MLRVAVICPAQGLRAWQRQSLEGMLGLGFVELSLLIVDAVNVDALNVDEMKATPRSLTARLIRLLTPALLRFAGLPHAAATVPAAPLGDGQAAAALVREHAVDLAICFCAAPVPDALLTAPGFGVWRYCFGPSMDGCGDPPCLEEICTEAPVVEIRLLRLADEAIGQVLKEAAVQTVKRSYRATLAAVVSAAVHLPAQVCVAIDKLGDSVVRERRFETDRRRREPTIARIVQALLMLLKNRITWLASGVSLSEQWTLGIVDKPITDCLDHDFLAGVRLMPADNAGYLADGFGLVRDGRRFVLCEQFDYAINRGVIAWLELDPGGGIRSGPAPALDIPCHASYPYLFSHDGRLFCCPETWESGAASLWEAVDPPASWRRTGEILVGVPAVDPVILRHDGLWWLLCTREDDRPNERLYGFYADAPTGPWRSHALNPIKIDVRSSRSAGTPFVKKGSLYRPAQDCSRTYGGRISINRVSELSPARFAEEPVHTIEPPGAGGFRHGIHTIAPLGEQTLIDAKRRRLSPRDLSLRIRKGLGGRRR